MATCIVYRRPAAKPRIAITHDIETRVLDALSRNSQQAVARKLGLSQSAVSKIARRHRADAAR